VYWNLDELLEALHDLYYIHNHYYIKQIRLVTNILTHSTPLLILYSQVMKLAAQAVGHMARINSQITTECVEFDIQKSFEWLQEERHETKRYAVLLGCLLYL